MKSREEKLHKIHISAERSIKKHLYLLLEKTMESTCLEINEFNNLFTYPLLFAPSPRFLDYSL